MLLVTALFFATALVLVTGEDSASSLENEDLSSGTLFNPEQIENDIKFYLFTLNNPNISQELTIGNDTILSASNYVAGAPLKILSHGFGSSTKYDPTVSFTEAYFRNGLNYNVIAVDWAPLAASPWYSRAVVATKAVGEKTARLVSYLVSRGLATLDDVHFIGHSLGSHVGGYFGSYLGAGKVSRITALDPAYPWFSLRSDSDRIDPSDAAFVDVIHTAASSGLSFNAPRGHVDFYPNGGSGQPGCGLDAFGACSHSRSMDYMAESIGNPDKFQACQCDSWKEFKRGKCDCSVTINMGENVPRSARGSFYLRTNSESPFSQS